MIKNDMIDTPKTARELTLITGITYVLPFRAHGYWVEDSRGRNVAEAVSKEVAAALAKLLNDTYNK
jgi:hypothetical protein